MNDKLEYLYDLKKDDVKDYYFVNYQAYGIGYRGARVYPEWIRKSWLSRGDLAYITAELNWDYIEHFRISSFRDMVEPVNKDGLTDKQCKVRKIDFIPVRQKIEHLFGHNWRITRRMLENKRMYPDSDNRKVIANSDHIHLSRNAVFDGEGNHYEYGSTGWQYSAKLHLEHINNVSSKRLADRKIDHALIRIDGMADEILKIMDDKEIHESETYELIQHLLEIGVSEVSRGLSSLKRNFWSYRDVEKEKARLRNLIQEDQKEAA
jgi:hypothetical protein